MKKIILFVLALAVLLFAFAAAPLFSIEISAEWLMLVAGAVLSLLFSYIPGLNTWYAALSEEVERLVMLVLLIVVVAALYILMCYGFIAIEGVACGQAGLVTMVYYLLLAVASNQTVYKVSPATTAVKKVKESK